jgi:hypothetical protein
MMTQRNDSNSVSKNKTDYESEWAMNYDKLSSYIVDTDI